MLLLRDLLQKNKAETKKHFTERLWLLSAILHKSQGELFLSGDSALGKKECAFYQKALRQRARGEPLQYIVGETDFYGRTFKTAKKVLIPRPETEVLVELLLRDFPNIPLRILDVGTGSGAIAVTAALERPLWRVAANDISPEALRLSRKNAEALRAQVYFLKKDLRALSLSQFDVVVSNPPYLEYGKDKITQEVKKHEPRLALEPMSSLKIPGLDRAAWAGEYLLRNCASSSPRPRALYMELSPRVATLLERRWKRNPLVQSIKREKDLAGRSRFLLVTWCQGNDVHG